MDDQEPDYSSYSNEELEDVLRNIDKERFPERAERLIAEISSRSKTDTCLSEKVDPFTSRKETVSIITETDGKIVQFITRAWCIAIFYLPAQDFYQALTEGTTYARSSGLVTFDENPITFTLEMLKSTILAAGLIYVMIKSPFGSKKRKTNKDQ